MKQNLILTANEKPKTSKWILLSFQHVFAMFSATVLVPILTGFAIPISVALFCSGIGTLIYILCTKAKVPMYLGSSFAYIPFITTINAQNGLGAVLTGLVTVGIIYALVALIIRFCGSGWLNKILPPVVVGPMIIVIGLGLAGSAIGNTGLVIGTDEVLLSNPVAGDWRAILTAIITMFAVAIFAIRGRGFVKVIPFLIGIGVGYVVGIIFGLIPNGDYSKIVDFTELIAVLKSPKDWFSIPTFHFLGWKNADLPLGMSMVAVNIAGAISVIPYAFATICEHIGDHEVLGKITGEDYLENPGLHRTLLGDGLATSFAGLVGGPANTSYGENTSVVGMTKVGSVWVTGLAAIFAIFLSFSNIITTFIATIPQPVMGGLCLILYGFIASNGLKTLIDAKVDMTKTRNLIIVSVMLVVGLGSAAINIGSCTFTGMSMAAIFGIILNLILPHEKKDQENEEIDIKKE